MRTTRIVVAAVAAASLLLTGCATGAAGTDGTSPAAEPSASADVSGDLTVYAAASLKAAFDEISSRFEQENPEVDILPIVYDGSSTLATQIIEGAPVDVFASADEANLTKVVDAGLAGSGQLFATNTLVVATPAGNPAEVQELADLADPAVSVVLCAEEVPCGAASAALLAQADVDVTPVSREQNVTAVLTKIAADEADAGLVYVTDVRGRDDVFSFAPEGADQVVNRYPIASLTAAPNPAAAAAFTAFVVGAEGQEILADFGFGAP
ncbi:molybdate ABC transporter substrate-binding protein [Microbacterium terricola]|uniref:Molybdate-binding protein n=1 Tax=Microbacterium terricola TaxID=344163 RepID=A0ABM8E152_9MICO|nr:molybdate ABC transporter substrate-binding protein [Microbacterium terricola]UYK40786.1 molybdate ABC transporter substrate-binding protein [Microbacterium terricola]BDV31471.1 molybdate-binding protein [Microbacterium terricola]